MRFRVVPFEPWHSLKDFEPMEDLGEERWRENLIAFYHSGPVYTGWYGDEVVGFGGVITYWQGVGEGWLMVNKKAGSLPRARLARCAATAVLNFLKNDMRRHGFRRVHALCYDAVPGAVKFCRLLGKRAMGQNPWLAFRHEGTMEGFCPNGDNCEMFAFTVRG